MTPIVLTPHQHSAVDWIVARIRDGTPLVALRGLAGTGKTSLIPALQAALEQHHLVTRVGAPTHRATMILRQQGIAEAETVHALALIPYFTADYRRALAWLGETWPGKLGDDTLPRDDVEGLPWLVHAAVQPDLTRGRDLQRRVGRYKARRLLASIGISGKDYFAGFGPKLGPGVLIIDEASMVGRSLLTTCQEAYQQIVLIGDPGQLPPVKDEAVLVEVEGVDLTEIHRQAAGSPLLQLAYRARQGTVSWQSPLTANVLAHGEHIQVGHTADVAQFVTAPLLVWRNVTRIRCTHAIRQALGYAKQVLMVGEPLLCRSTSSEDRALGFYNNGLYTIVAIDPDHPRRLTVMDVLGNTETIVAHLEECDGDAIDPQAIPFRFAYCLTTHTAQGGEWPMVFLSLPELWLYVNVQGKRGRTEEIAQWTYTAITRAKTTLRLLTQHTFLPLQERSPMAAPREKLTPPSAPLLDMPAPRDDRDDIADPVVPPSLQDTLTQATPSQTAQDAPGDTQALPPARTRGDGVARTGQERDALLVGFLEALRPKLHGMLHDEFRAVVQSIDSTFLAVKKLVDLAGQPNEHAQYQLSDTLSHLLERGLALRHEPVVAQVHVVSPAGFPVDITLKQASLAALYEELPALIGWLCDEGCTPPSFEYKEGR